MFVLALRLQGARPKRAPVEVDADGLLLAHLDVLGATQQRADRGRDLGGGEARHRHLVEQGLEQVVVAAVEDDDLEVVGARQALGGREARKAGPDDQHALQRGPASIRATASQCSGASPACARPPDMQVA